MFALVEKGKKNTPTACKATLKATGLAPQWKPAGKWGETSMYTFMAAAPVDDCACVFTNVWWPHQFHRGKSSYFLRIILAPFAFPHIIVDWHAQCHLSFDCGSSKQSPPINLVQPIMCLQSSHPSGNGAKSVREVFLGRVSWITLNATYSAFLTGLLFRREHRLQVKKKYVDTSFPIIFTLKDSPKSLSSVGLKTVPYLLSFNPRVKSRRGFFPFKNFFITQTSNIQ